MTPEQDERLVTALETIAKANMAILRLQQDAIHPMITSVAPDVPPPAYRATLGGPSAQVMVDAEITSVPTDPADAPPA
jgi:hypothetical protein